VFAGQGTLAFEERIIINQIYSRHGRILYDTLLWKHR
jgi:hypothetical protein